MDQILIAAARLQHGERMVAAFYGQDFDRRRRSRIRDRFLDLVRPAKRITRTLHDQGGDRQLLQMSDAVAGAFATRKLRQARPAEIF